MIDEIIKKKKRGLNKRINEKIHIKKNIALALKRQNIIANSLQRG